MAKFLPSLLLACLSFLWSCDLINPEEKIPSYIRIDSIGVTTDPTTQGTNSNSVTDAWIFVDDQLVGAFELPCNVPALYSGNHKISVGAGIKINGISSLRAPYPFYRFYETNTTLSEGNSVTISPTVTYFDSLQFGFMANFDDISGSKLEGSGATDTTISITNDPNLTFEGGGSLIAQLLRDSGFVEFQFVEPVELPKQGTTVYLEFDYKLSHVLSVGLKSYYQSAGTRSSELINLNPTDTWKKVYVNMTKAVSEQVNAINYRVFFYSKKQAGSGPLQLLIDNMKIIY